MRDDRSPIVCVHGAGGGAWEWQIWARMLRAYGHRVLARDLQPGDAGLAATGLADYRAQLLAWCASSPRPMLLGASLGGLLALSVAAEVQARALVLVNPVPPWGLPIATPGDRSIVPWHSARRWAGTLRALPDADDAARLFAYRHWRDESARVLAEVRHGLRHAPPRCPVLVLVSSDDQDVPPAQGVRVAESLGGRWQCVEGASHVGPLLGWRAAALAEQVALWLMAQTRRDDPV